MEFVKADECKNKSAEGTGAFGYAPRRSIRRIGGRRPEIILFWAQRPLSKAERAFAISKVRASTWDGPLNPDRYFPEVGKLIPGPKKHSYALIFPSFIVK